MKIKVFTVNVGNYDLPRTDIENINICNIFKNNARNARCVKTLAHKYFDADFSIHCDANIVIHPHLTPEKIIEKYLGDADMCVTLRKSNSCVYKEIELAKYRVNNSEERKILDAQAAYYRSIGIPENIGIYGYQPFIRRHSTIMNRFCEAWWAEMCRWSYRDQISFPVVLRDFPQIKIKHVKLSELYTKTCRHGHRIFPKVSK